MVTHTLLMVGSTMGVSLSGVDHHMVRMVLK